MYNVRVSFINYEYLQKINSITGISIQQLANDFMAKEIRRHERKMNKRKITRKVN